MNLILLSITLVNIANILGALGSLYIKKGADKLSLSIHSIIRNKEMILGLVFYGIATIIFIPALKFADLSIVYPFAALKLSWSFYSIILNYYIYIGLFFYFISFVILVISLKHGELSVLYPIYGLNYVWVALLSSYFFSEIINLQKWIGVIIIIIGVSFIGVGSAK